VKWKLVQQNIPFNASYELRQIWLTVRAAGTQADTAYMSHIQQAVHQTHNKQHDFSRYEAAM
jgi:hypothetical protein